MSVKMDWFILYSSVVFCFVNCIGFFVFLFCKEQQFLVILKKTQICSTLFYLSVSFSNAINIVCSTSFTVCTLFMLLHHGLDLVSRYMAHYKCLFIIINQIDMRHIGSMC